MENLKASDFNIVLANSGLSLPDCKLEKKNHLSYGGDKNVKICLWVKA